MEQNTKEWLAMRKRYIGASDAPIIMGTSKFCLADGRPKTPNILWHEKLGLLSLYEDTSATRYGKQMEEPARQEYIKMTGKVVEPKIIFHPNIPYMMASLDGLSLDGTIAVEIKNSNSEDHECARNGKVPIHYYAQVQHQLACLGNPIMHYFSFHKGEGIIVDVFRDDSYLKELYEKEKQFWICVESLKEPELVDKDFNMMDKNWGDKCQSLLDLKSQIKLLSNQAEELEEEIKILCQQKSSMYQDFRMVRTFRKGNINYEAIPQLKNVDLQCYRKPNTVTWILKKLKK